MGNRRRPTNPAAAAIDGHIAPPGTPAIEQGYWNGLPTQVRRVVVEVGTFERPDSVAPEHWKPWCAGLEGTHRAAVWVSLEGVNYGGGSCFLDDENGSGWAKVTEGHGGPAWPHRDLPVASVIGVRS